jgi:RimJ/RimL family protein N-acetyltransferase/aminoglycoside phosphotransferase (APT) family kinase protein
LNTLPSQRRRVAPRPKITFRPLRAEDLPQLADWQTRPHVARWWRDPSDLASVTAEFLPTIEGREPTEVFVIEVDGHAAGIIQRYLVDDYPPWAAAVGLRDAAGIDYYLGEEGLLGRGLGSRAIAQFTTATLARYPQAQIVTADPLQENVASWRALEKAGFTRLWAGLLESDDPSDDGPAYLYGFARPGGPHPNHRPRHTLPVELRRTTVPAEVGAWVLGVTGSPITGTRRLAGASSTAIHLLRLADGTRLILRRYVWPGFLEAEPLAPQREAEALAFARAHGLPVPELVAVDLTGETAGDRVPALLMTCLAGRAVALPDPRLLAEMAATIHDVDAAGFGHEYFAWYEETTTAPPPGSTRPELWERAITLWHQARPSFRPTFIHRDFHPGNVLWARHRLSGVVDWANACRGPRGCDVATCRRNLIDLAGVTAGDGFLAAYEAVTGERHDPYWDLAGILEAGPSFWTPQRVVEHEPRLAAALAAMA